MSLCAGTDCSIGVTEFAIDECAHRAYVAASHEILVSFPTPHRERQHNLHIIDTATDAATKLSIVSYITGFFSDMMMAPDPMRSQLFYYLRPLARLHRMSLGPPLNVTQHDTPLDPFLMAVSGSNLFIAGFPNTGSSFVVEILAS